MIKVHRCPECCKCFGQKSNIKAHCGKIFTNWSFMNQHIKRTQNVATIAAVIKNTTVLPVLVVEQNQLSN